MAGPAPTTTQNDRDRSAGPVHSSGWLVGRPCGWIAQHHDLVRKLLRCPPAASEVLRPSLLEQPGLLLCKRGVTAIVGLRDVVETLAQRIMHVAQQLNLTLTLACRFEDAAREGGEPDAENESNDYGKRLHEAH
jgi:hypothetical protein